MECIVGKKTSGCFDKGLLLQSDVPVTLSVLFLDDLIHQCHLEKKPDHVEISFYEKGI